MPRPRAVTVADPALLLSRAVNGLFPLAPPTEAEPWPTLSAWIVLRQGGLRDDLHRLAASRGVAGWFESPICLFNEIADRWGGTAEPSALSEPERLTIVSTLASRFGGKVFGGALKADTWVPAIDRLLGELTSEGITVHDFESALTSTASDVFSITRAESLARIYSEWVLELRRINRTDGRDGKIRLAHSIVEDPNGFEKRLGGRRDIRFVGLADLRGGWRTLLAALAVSPAIDRLEIITSARVELPPELNPEYTDETPDISFARALFSEQKCEVPSVCLLEAPDAAREVELIAVRVRELLDAGTPPSRIAVITRQARPLVNDVSRALLRLGVPVTARRRTTLSHTAPARAARAILEAVRDSWSRHAVVELAENPLLSTGLDAAVLNVVGFTRPIESRAAWRGALAELLARCERRAKGEESEDEHRQVLPEAERVRATLAAWDALDPRLAVIEGSRSPSAWFAWISDTLRDTAWGIATALAKPIVDRDAWNVDVRASDLIAELSLAWVNALSEFGATHEPITADAFGERLDLLLDHDLITPPTTDFGVVVGEALAAGWRSFDHVFVLGLSAGTFPQRPSPGAILDRDDRRALIDAGLPLDPPDAWRSREQELFRVVCAAPTHTLTLSWPVMDAAGREVTRSAFVDEAASTLARSLSIENEDDALESAGILERIPTNAALVRGFPVANTSAAIDHARVLAARENDRSLAPSPWNGSIEDQELLAWLSTRYGASFVWSATQLEQVAKCRWHWFAQRLLRLDTQGEPDDSMEPTTRGSIMHAALHSFFTGLKAKSSEPVFLTEDPGGELANQMTAALKSAWADAGEKDEWLGPLALRTVAREELRVELLGYLKFELDWNTKSFKGNTNASKQIRTGFVDGELKLNSVELVGNGLRFLLRGSVDRVDHGIDDRVPTAAQYIAAIDYKSSIYSTPAGGKKTGWDDGVVLQVPLYAAALRKQYPDTLLSRMEYRTLRSPAVVHPLSLAPLKKGEVQDATDAEAKLDGALDAAGRRIGEVRRGELPANPAPSCGCSPYCPARDVCRIPNGPVSTGW
jgi:ATP-dependent helicase/nuclease subunit B